MAASRYREARSKRDVGGFVALPFMVLQGEEFAALSAIAVKLLMDLLAQYRGNNNGDFTLTWSVMEKRGWRSRDTLERARQELLSRGWIALTAQGGLHKPSLYGVTIFALDPSSKLEVTTKSFPRGAWKRKSIVVPPQKNESSITPVVLDRGQIDTPVVSIGPATPSIDTPVVIVKGGLPEELTRRSCTSIELPSPGAVLGDPSPPTLNPDAVALQKPSGRSPKPRSGFDRGLFRPQ